MESGNEKCLFLAVSSHALSIGHREVERTSINSPPCPHASSPARGASLLSLPIDITSAFHNYRACIRWFLIVRSQCNMVIELPSRAMLQRARNLSGDG